MDTQAADVVIFDFKATGVRCVSCCKIERLSNAFLFSA